MFIFRDPCLQPMPRTTRSSNQMKLLAGQSELKELSHSFRLRDVPNHEHSSLRTLANKFSSVNVGLRWMPTRNHFATGPLGAAFATV